MAAVDPEQGTGDEVTGRSWGQLRGPVESKVWNMVKTFAFTLRDLGRQVSFLNGLVVVNMSCSLEAIKPTTSHDFSEFFFFHSFLNYLGPTLNNQDFYSSKSWLSNHLKAQIFELHSAPQQDPEN